MSTVGVTLVDSKVVYMVLAPNVNFRTLLSVSVTMVWVTTGVVAIWNDGCGNSGLNTDGCNPGNVFVTYSYSVLVSVAVGLEMVVKKVLAPLNMGRMWVSYAVSTFTTGLEDVSRFGRAALGFSNLSSANCCSWSGVSAGVVGDSGELDGGAPVVVL